MVMIVIKRKCIKLLHRINRSRTTQLFILSSILQAIIITALEVRVFHRNNDTSISLVAYARSSNPSMSCLVPDLFILNNIIEENIIFIIFQIFQMWLCFNAIYTQNTVQIVTTAAVTFFCALFAIVQILEVRKWYGNIGKLCQAPLKFESYPKFLSYDIPLMIALIIFGFIMAFLGWKLYRQLGWNIYKKIGGDINTQAMFKTYLSYEMLLKLGLFFILGLALEACIVFKINLVEHTSINRIRFLPRHFYLFHIAVTGLTFLIQIIGYRSAKREIKVGMICLCVFWAAIIIDFCILMKYSISVKDSWYFFIVFLSIGIIISFFSLIWSVFVYNNFGRGLKDRLNQKDKEEPVFYLRYAPI